MGSYTALRIVPASDPEWLPDGRFIRALFRHLGAINVWSMSGYPIPLYWGNTAAAIERIAYDLTDISLGKALDTVKRRRAVTTAIRLTSLDWSNRLRDSLAVVPESLTDGYGPWDVSLNVGPFSIPTPEHDGTMGTYCFEVKLSGHGMPNDWDEYLSFVRQDPVINELLAFLREHSGKEWEILMSSSY